VHANACVTSILQGPSSSVDLHELCIYVYISTLGYLYRYLRNSILLFSTLYTILNWIFHAGGNSSSNVSSSPPLTAPTRTAPAPPDLAVLLDPPRPSNPPRISRSRPAPRAASGSVYCSALVVHVLAHATIMESFKALNSADATNWCLSNTWRRVATKYISWGSCLSS
jgi:hypothetical protein